MLFFSRANNKSFLSEMLTIFVSKRERVLVVHTLNNIYSAFSLKKFNALVFLNNFNTIAKSYFNIFLSCQKSKIHIFVEL